MAILHEGSEVVCVGENPDVIKFGVVAGIDRGYTVNLDGGVQVRRAIPSSHIVAVVLVSTGYAPVVRFEYTLSPGTLFGADVVPDGIYAVAREVDGARCPCCRSVDHVEQGSEANHCLWCETAWIPGEEL